MDVKILDFYAGFRSERTYFLSVLEKSWTQKPIFLKAWNCFVRKTVRWDYLFFCARSDIGIHKILDILTPLFCSEKGDFLYFLTRTSDIRNTAKNIKYHIQDFALRMPLPIKKCMNGLQFLKSQRPTTQ